ncbi:Phosphatidylserine decarboxylase proenzyme [Vibrio aerogenes CECT 7868]|uniref:Phosphatidylserine decarboxylase proenzyme n=1 Tax=Vibrio aerogenes CECT 7868 TaxID=1216006 RepID=A0A1M5Z533_9VIBR|nr:phosphatidylserine decarboxylase [Vibrio aerogenes]SHI19362.1 Phosphatidylserine decarboxylase proenzyme [Vibrio aerogenes CECT 7868]
MPVPNQPSDSDRRSVSETRAGPVKPHRIPQIQYINRETGLKETERVYGEQALMFLYHTRSGVFLRKHLFRHPWFSHLNAIKKRLWLSRRHIREFADTFGVAIDEAEKPIGDYHSLDEFFCRRLTPQARPLCPEHRALLSPADGRVLCYPIRPGAKMQLKGQQVSLEALLRSAESAAALDGGTALVIRLAPKDYHRFHFPCDGTLAHQKNISGPLESVHPIALSSGAQSFLNKRTITTITSPHFGEIVMAEIGALTIGTIEQTFSGTTFSRGQEKGCFRFGGSTVVLLWGPEGPTVDADILANSTSGIETLVKYGTQIAALHNN